MLEVIQAHLYISGMESVDLLFLPSDKHSFVNIPVTLSYKPSRTTVTICTVYINILAIPVLWVVSVARVNLASMSHPHTQTHPLGR